MKSQHGVFICFFIDFTKIAADSTYSGLFITNCTIAYLWFPFILVSISHVFTYSGVLCSMFGLA